MDTAILAGQIMLECNAESYRVEETMNIFSPLQTWNLQAFAMATGIFATCWRLHRFYYRNPSCSKPRRWTNRIYKVNAISRQLVTNWPRYSSLSTITGLKNRISQWLKDLEPHSMCGFYRCSVGATPVRTRHCISIMPFIYKLDPRS